MRVALLVTGCVGWVSVAEAHATLRHTSGARRSDPDEQHIKDIEGEFKDAAQPFRDMYKDAQKGPGYHGNAKKPMMDGVEVMRSSMCINRNKLIEHEDCMEFLTEKCKEETSGHGYCRKFEKYVKAKCRRGNEVGCSYAQKLGVAAAKEGEDKSEEQGAQAAAINDEDGDGVIDSEDAFPDNPIESKDSDGDGIGDNTDKFPNDPSRAHEGEVAAAPAPAAMVAPSPGPMPTGLKMDATAALPSQGYNEHSLKNVAHQDKKTMTKDWRAEWPMEDASEQETIGNICDKQPHHAWCKLKRSRSARSAYVRSHP